MKRYSVTWKLSKEKRSGVFTRMPVSTSFAADVHKVSPNVTGVYPSLFAQHQGQLFDSLEQAGTR